MPCVLLRRLSHATTDGFAQEDLAKIAHANKSLAAPFILRSGEDIQAMFGAQTGNPPILPVEQKSKRKSQVPKKKPTAVKKAAKSKKSKPADPKTKAKRVKRKP